MSKFACYCSVGVMSQCVADNVYEQQACHFSEQSANANKCMFRNENMFNHCWNPDAQAFGREHGVVRIEDVEIDEPETLYDESLELELEEPRRNCRNCISYTSCPLLINLATAATAHGGITEQDLWNQASRCGGYIGETKISISGGA